MTRANGLAGHAEPSSPAAATSDVNNSSDRFRLFALVALTAAIITLCVILAVPFLPAITWAVALAIMAWPMHAWVSGYIANRSVAATISSFGVVLLILVPALFVSYQLAHEAAAGADKVQEVAEGGLRAKMLTVPYLRDIVAWMDRVDVDIETEVRKTVSSYTSDMSGIVQGSMTAAIQILVAMFILFHVFRDRSTLMQGVRSLLPLSRDESDRVFARATDSVHANVYATLITSLLDGAGGGVMFWLLGLPAPVMWGVVMFVLSVLPVVGAGLVWAPAAAALALSDHWGHAAALVAWGLLSFAIVDNIIYVRLAGRRMRMHEVPALVAFLGGLAIFGMSGMILGPAIMAVTVAVLEVWKDRLARAEEGTLAK